MPACLLLPEGTTPQNEWFTLNPGRCVRRQPLSTVCIVLFGGAFGGGLLRRYSVFARWTRHSAIRTCFSRVVSLRCPVSLCHWDLLVCSVNFLRNHFSLQVLYFVCFGGAGCQFSWQMQGIVSLKVVCQAGSLWRCLACKTAWPAA